MPSDTFDLMPVVARLQEEVYGLLAALPLFVLAMLVVWIAWVVGGWLSRRALLARAMSRKSPFLKDLAATTVRWLVLIVGALVALEIMDATALAGAVLGSAGVLGVALGFAFKDILENYLAGILMSVRQPFAPRDHVVIDGNEGLVVALNSRATILMTLDGNHLRLPNALVFRSVTLNYTRNPNRRFEIDVGIGVNDDLVRASKIGVDELLRVDGVVDKPPARALVVALGDSNVQMRFYGWVDQRSHDFLLVRSEAIRRVKLALEAAGMDLPEPIYRVQLLEPDDHDAPSVPSPQARAEEASEAIDTGANADVLSQLQADRDASGDKDLLDPHGAKE